MQANDIYEIDYKKGLKKLPDKSIDVVLTDPPYFFEPHARGLSRKRKYLHEGVKKIGVNNKKDLVDKPFLEELLRVCKKPNIFIFCNKAQIPLLIAFTKKRGLNFELIPLCKTAPMPLMMNAWLPDREWGVHIFKNLDTDLGDYKTKRGFFIAENFKDMNIDHPTPKPLEILRRIILNISRKDDLVLDCFMGSGATAVACKELQRNFIGFEINKEYIDLAKRRLSQTSLQAYFIE